jgi:hypothetical protein
MCLYLETPHPHKHRFVIKQLPAAISGIRGWQYVLVDTCIDFPLYLPPQVRAQVTRLLALADPRKYAPPEPGPPQGPLAETPLAVKT